jgi:hypothetical protein
MLRKISVFLGSFILVFFSAFTRVNAEGEFNTDFDVTYKVDPSGVTTVTNRITLTNVFSNLYATSYSVVLDSMEPTNIKSYGDGGRIYETTIETSDKTTTITTTFPDAVVGKNESRTFWVSYDEPGFAVRTGEVWEISIPKISEEAEFASYKATLSVPESFGQEAYISPNPLSKNNIDGYINYNFSKTSIEKTGVVAGFGNFQVFSFTLNYHLENPLVKTSKTEIALPPDTVFQRMYYENINPRPQDIYVDSDGNWIAVYELKPRERIDVVANGSVQIFSTIRHFPPPTTDTLNNNLLPTTYWQTADPKIIALSSDLKTPKAIYDYVVSTLSYDYSRVRPNIDRLGAVAALNQPDAAICMEFTDLFITLARAAGIPAREINGYAYTENPEIQPLSLVNDVLHSWPEYYDSTKKSWVPVDPTWESTTGGVDFFNKLDLRHFTFVIHGADDTKPYAPGSYKLGTNPQKDIFVSFGKLPEERNSEPRVLAEIGGWIPFLPNKLNLTIENPGPVALYSINPFIYFDSKKTASSVFVEVLLPFQVYKAFLDIPFSFLGTSTPDEVKVIVESESVTIPTNKKQVVIYNLIFIFVSAILILLTLLFRLKRWKFKLPKLRIFQRSR